ncbi:MobA/MobL family protein [Bradyrhizobium arachidis]|uniref:MobA/MobL family protein n=1 Tax=Bradyrhizobium arachidis TaxID=858423 RepID=UPI00142E8EBC|nr:MobA/MobL family protein [Bradyrhizobium arachidis]
MNLGLVRRSRGGDAIEHSAYLRGGTARRRDGLLVDFSQRTDVLKNFVVRPQGTPAWAADCAQLWKRAVAAEKRKNAQEARLIELSIPRALPRQYWVELAKRLARDLATRGMVVQVAVHCPMASDGLENPHIHFMATMREIVNGEFSPKKARHWNDLFLFKAKAIRSQMAEALNQFCEEKDVSYRVDARSNAELDLPAAEVHIPRWNILYYKRTGKKTTAIQQRDEERVARAEVARLEAECRKLERELEEARAEASVPVADEISLVTPAKMARRPVIEGLAKPSLREKVPAETMAPVSTNFELPGPRYGP